MTGNLQANITKTIQHSLARPIVRHFEEGVGHTNSDFP